MRLKQQELAEMIDFESQRDIDCNAGEGDLREKDDKAEMEPIDTVKAIKTSGGT